MGFTCQHYKTFCNCNLQMCSLSQSTCPWQSFPAQSYLCRQYQEPTLERKVLHLGRLRPYSQTVDQDGKAFQGQSLQLLLLIHKCCKKFYSTDHRASTTNIFMLRINTAVLEASNVISATLFHPNLYLWVKLEPNLTSPHKAT